MCESSYNCRLLTYPEGQHVTIYRRSINKGEKNAHLSKTFQRTGKQDFEQEEQHCKNVSLSRTKNTIYNIARSNVWEWFITLTFNRELTDSASYDEVTAKLNDFFANLRKRRCPGLKYLIVPELHKDGIHYHFHGLLSNIDGLQFRFSDHYDKNGNPIFNVVNWSFGFTTATRVTDTSRVSSYITKYVTKATEQYLKEKRRYYASRNIERAKGEYYIIDEEEFQEMYRDDIQYVKTVNIPAAHQQVTYYEI